ncbi:unnamed protein product [Calicophoron daubneyi]|uniref:Ankyrin n=1 Tax=Calicophoron daubneyi TaxID=300641 RepID=A0AAV2T225_CALDB
MTVTGENVAAASSESTASSKKTDASQNFLRAARAGNLQKVLDLLNRYNVDIHSCNANGLNALHLASKEGHFQVVRELLTRGAEPNKATKKGNTALHIASLAGQFEVVKMLLDAGADINVQAQNGFTPLYMAAQENHLEVVKLLLARNANPALTTDDGFTPLAVALQQGHDRIVALLLENDSRGKVCLPALHIAAKKDDVKAANLLLNSDVNVDHQSTSGFTPLHIAAHYGNVNMTDLLISRGANINFQAKNNITPLHVACKWGNLGVAERLIAAGAELDCRTRDGLTPLHCAARSGHDTVVQLLLNAGANSGAKTRSGLNAVHMAAQGDHVDAARLLLQRGVPVDDTTIDYLTALHVAAHCGNIQIAKLLIERSCDINARALNGFTPLHIACQKNRTKIVELLLKYNCLLEATTESGLTPLHVASFMGHLSIIILLLQHGANPNSPTMRSETALHLATRSGQTEVARLLIRNGAQVDARARGNQTPLHIAARIGNTEIASLLIEHSANVHAATKDAYTPLHLAAKGNHVEIMKFLLKAEAELEPLTRSEFTPLHLAAKHSHPEAAQLLVDAGANVNASGRNGLTVLHLATHYASVPLVKMLLEHKADPTAQAKNGYTPLHIAAEKRLVEIAKLLIGAQGGKNVSNMESRNGFSALHLASQEGSPEMTKLLLDNGAKVNARAKNGLTPMHLAAQEDSLKAAELLFAAGSELDAKTKAGYTPLHTACHFGQTNMVRFLLGKGVDVNAQTCLGSNALHLAAQQGHSKVVFILLESGANPNMRNKNGWTPAHVARRQHYLNIFEVLRQVTTCVESWEAEDELEAKMTEAELAKATQEAGGHRVLLEQPDLMGDHAVTDTEEEGAEPDYTVIPSSPLFSRSINAPHPLSDHGIIDGHMIGATVINRYTNGPNRNAADKMSNVSGEDSIHENHADQLQNGVANIGREPSWTATRVNRDFAELHALSSGLPGSTEWDFAPDNVPIARKPVTSGFLVSFLVDARGGSMRGSRHPGLRILVPPSAASAPTRVTCRMLRPERTTRPPQLNDSEGLACRIIELGPHPCTFNTPVLLEIPHFASLRGRQRELVVLRSDNGEKWYEHSLEATDQAVQSALGQSFDNLETLEELREKRIIRILTNEFPQYLAVVSRLRQETAMIGSDGGVLSSTVVPQVQAVFPEGALQKRIRVGLQAHPIAHEMVVRLLGNRVAVSPIVTLEPRRRKFHKPITLTIPLPKTAFRGMMNPAGGDLKAPNAPSLRLLCSITGGTLPAQWEDITGSTPLSKVKDCVSFTTTVSARFWLVDCQAVHESTELAGQLYREASLVPYMGKFVVFTKRLDTDEALIRCFCVTDDKVDKTLECQEGFEVCAASPEVEVVEARAAYLEAAGNLLPVAKSGDQLRLHFNAFHENRLAFPVRVKDIQQEPAGKLAFMREPRMVGGSSVSAESGVSALGPQRPICTLEVNLGPDNAARAALAAHMAAANSTMIDIGMPSISDQLNTSVGASMSSLQCVFPQKGLMEPEQGDYRETSPGRWASVYAADVIARSQLDLLQVANEIGSDWPKVVPLLLPNSNLGSNCTVEQLAAWIVQAEPRWQGYHNQKGPEGGFAGLTAGEMRTDRDRALAVLLAWREERGELATGNELYRALRSIGRFDVIKSCMRDIQYVTEEQEHAEASRRIDGKPPLMQEEEPVSTSLVGTATLMSGMEDIPADQIGGRGVSRAVKKPREPVAEEEIITENRSSLDHSVAPPDMKEVEEEEGPTEAPASISAQLVTDHEEPSKPEDTVGGEEEVAEYTEDSWQNGSPPATTTSQQGGDPMVSQAAKDMVPSAEESDIVRDSESMTASIEGPSGTSMEEGTKSTTENLTPEEQSTGQLGSETKPSVSEPVVEGQGDQASRTSEFEEKKSAEASSKPETEEGDQAGKESVKESEREAQKPVEKETHGVDEQITEQGAHEGSETGKTMEEQHEEGELRTVDAHHAGGDSPSSEELAAPLKYYNETTGSEHEEIVEGDVPEDTEHPMASAHHGVEAESGTRPADTQPHEE